jgi:DNA helicase II / ATP-dependent DNA helicase PcrA
MTQRPPDPVSSDFAPAPEEVQEEQRLLASSRQVLLEHPSGQGATDQDALAEMTALRAAVGTAKTEDLGSLFQQYDQLAQRVHQLQARAGELQVDPDCPYFAHLGLEDQRGRRDIFLGRATRLDNGLRIVDWRNAPVSGIFYRYQEGEEYDEQVGDVLLEGRVVARRTLGILAGELQRVDGAEASWAREGDRWRRLARGSVRLAGGAGSSFRVREGPARLGTGRQHRADKHLPEIAALIDPAQFELITRPSSGLVAIRGGAGSGKTTVALHRIAYLAYAEPRRFHPTRMIILVWGKALEAYVAHVLPALGVEGVLVSTWEKWARKMRIRHFGRLPRKAREDTPSIVTRLKLHPGLARIMKRRVQQRDADPKATEAIDDFVSLLADGPRVTHELGRAHPGDFTEQQLGHAARLLQDQASALRAWLEGNREGDSMLDPEDDALLLRCWQLRVGPLRSRRQRSLRYAHLVIDEVQDFSPLEVRVILDCLDPGRSATIAGDTAQHILAGTGFTSWQQFFDELSLEGTVVETLRVAYRSTHQIASFGLQLLGDDHQDAPPRTVRDGPPVELFRFTDHGACVAFLGDALRGLLEAEPRANVALIAPDAAKARMYHRGLERAELDKLSLVLEQDFCFEPGIEVTPIQDVKGLEFDYVVLLDVSAQAYADTDLARRQLHVGATRAIHQLWICSVGTPAAPVRSVLAKPPAEAP